jgi:hypothetical protein
VSLGRWASRALLRGHACREHALQRSFARDQGAFQLESLAFELARLGPCDRRFQVGACGGLDFAALGGIRGERICAGTLGLECPEIFGGYARSVERHGTLLQVCKELPARGALGLGAGCCE